jgi:glycosyltransferase involved in cell wall biosynthesis
MLFSVVICTHKRPASLKRTLEAVSQLQVPADVLWEVLVIDNASQDETPQVVRQAAERSAAPIRYVYEERLGLSAARNRGIRESQGEFVALTDDDALPHPDWLTQLHSGFRTYEAQIVFGKAIPCWESKPPSWYSKRFDHLFALLDYGPGPFVVTDKTHPLFGVNHACRRDALQALNGYQEALGLTGSVGGLEDTDLFERALASQMRIVYYPAAVVEHVIPDWRCAKQFYRRRVWGGTEQFYRTLHEEQKHVPWLLGLPRYLYRIGLDDLLAYCRGVLRRDPSDSFYHELRVIRFISLLCQAFRHRFSSARSSRGFA